MKKTHVDFNSAQGYPRGTDLFYECQRCRKILNSMSEENVWCDCYNLCVDADAGRLAVQDDSLIELVRIEEDAVNNK